MWYRVRVGLAAGNGGRGEVRALHLHPEQRATDLHAQTLSVVDAATKSSADPTHHTNRMKTTLEFEPTAFHRGKGELEVGRRAWRRERWTD